jgi:tRNA G18 (ribose-2'-O)-methylase SpoU
VLVLGSEVSGIDPGLLALADETVRLPMFGVKRSLNVAVAFGIAAFELSRKLIDQSAK